MKSNINLFIVQQKNDIIRSRSSAFPITCEQSMGKFSTTQITSFIRVTIPNPATNVIQQNLTDFDVKLGGVNFF